MSHGVSLLPKRLHPKGLPLGQIIVYHIMVSSPILAVDIKKVRPEGRRIGSNFSITKRATEPMFSLMITPNNREGCAVSTVSNQ